MLDMIKQLNDPEFVKQMQEAPAAMNAKLDAIYAETVKCSEAALLQLRALSEYVLYGKLDTGTVFAIHAMLGPIGDEPGEGSDTDLDLGGER